jgi:UPF0716 protein FxsA
MIAGFYSLRAGQIPAGSLKLVLLAWLVSEIVVFSLAAKVLGLGLTVLLTVGSSILGVALLRRLGVEAAQHLRRTMGGAGADSGVVVDGTLTAIGALLLIIPGFVSDAIGLALAAPSIRQAIAARFVAPARSDRSKPVGRKTQPDVIDLSPEDWTVVDKSSRT